MTIKETAVILASGSPRRIDMLRADGVEPVIVKPDCEENIHMDLTPKQEVMALALRKNLRAVEMLREQGELPAEGVVLSADTMVVLDGVPIGKPSDREDAFRILSELNGKKHTVCSGACICDLSSGRRLLFSEETDVHFMRYTDEDIRAYIATGEPMDKAGAYAIQGGFAPYVTHTEGPLDNVIGFPYGTIKNILASW
ncbi:MAG: septum formation protein Maf [Firmicutes bacterium]|nr:septum formation protein Maf [Bacillota bacterium]